MEVPVFPVTSRPTIGTRTTALLAAVLALFIVFGPVGAAGATEEPPPVRWSTIPADESGPDGRRVVEHTLDPGDTVEEHLAVRNLSEEEVTFELAAADGLYTRSGRFDMLPSGEESVAAGTWITLPDSVTVGPGETEVVEFSIAVPQHAEPGDHAAGITASVLTVQSAQDGTSVGVESRVGFRVTTRVTGELRAGAEVADISASYTGTWNAVRPGQVAVSFDLRNDGNTRLFVEGGVAAGGGSTEILTDGGREEILPGDTRRLTLVVDGVWPLVYVPVELSIAPEMVAMDGSTAALEPMVIDTAVWAFPWPQLLILSGLVLIFGAIFWGRRRSRRRLEHMLAEARDEGRRAAAQGPVDV